MKYLPGTKLEVTEIAGGFDYLMPSIHIANGLTLSQVKTITGLEQSTIQNWIKRGWVAHPENKRYGEYQLARILILNMLRASMQLDSIAKLLRFINGDAENREDDIIPDSVLYTNLCSVISVCEKSQTTDEEVIRDAVHNVIENYKELYPGARLKLCDALTVMTMAYISAEMQHKMEEFLEKLPLG